ncbi:MAG: DUF4421 family protein [Flavitalea sp.]
MGNGRSAKLHGAMGYMTRWLLDMIFFAVIFLTDYPCLIAQQPDIDSNYIRKFERSNVIEVYPGSYSSRFNFSTPGMHRKDYSLVANSSGYVGIYLNYKWISLKYSWGMPGTQLDNGVKLKYASLDFRFGGRKMAFWPFYDSYNGLLIPGINRRNGYKPFRNIQFTDAGADFYYFTNTRRFSFGAANYFSEQQTRSAGSVFLMGTPLWQQVNWKNPSRNMVRDSATFKLLSLNPQWVSAIARIGYTYNFIFQEGQWSIAPAVLIGGGGLREINTANKHLQAVYDLQSWVNAGYNGPRYYFYINARWDDLQTNLFIKNLSRINTDFSVTAGYRFHSLKKKIAQIL